MRIESRKQSSWLRISHVSPLGKRLIVRIRAANCHGTATPLNSRMLNLNFSCVSRTIIHKRSSYRREALSGWRDHLVGFAVDKCIIDFHTAHVVSKIKLYADKLEYLKRAAFNLTRNSFFRKRANKRQN